MSAMAMAVAVAMSAALAGCREVDPEVTGLRVEVSWSDAVTVDQLAVQLSSGVPRTDLGPRELRPVTAAATPLMSPTDLVVYLPDSQAGQALQVQVDGLRGGLVVATTTAQAEVTLSEVRKVAMLLGTAATETATGTAADGGAK
jgi:hypothetical protein